jgi:hypothetical protein
MNQNWKKLDSNMITCNSCTLPRVIGGCRINAGRYGPWRIFRFEDTLAIKYFLFFFAASCFCLLDTWLSESTIIYHSQPRYAQLSSLGELIAQTPCYARENHIRSAGPELANQAPKWQAFRQWSSTNRAPSSIVFRKSVKIITSAFQPS